MRTLLAAAVRDLTTDLLEVQQNVHASVEFA